jgi:uncharacterized cupredoxin-like copper-binding protein
MSIWLKAVGAAALVAGLLALAGCGDDDDDEPTAADTGAEETTQEETTAGGGGGGGGAGESVPVSLKDFSIDPPNPTVSAGTVTFDISNDGETTHNLEVEGPDEEAELEQDLAPGETGTLDVDLSEPGTYEWYCPVGNHRDLGMAGEVTVQ